VIERFTGLYNPQHIKIEIFKHLYYLQKKYFWNYKNYVVLQEHVELQEEEEAASSPSLLVSTSAATHFQNIYNSRFKTKTMYDMCYRL